MLWKLYQMCDIWWMNSGLVYRCLMLQMFFYLQVVVQVGQDEGGIGCVGDLSVSRYRISVLLQFFQWQGRKLLFFLFGGFQLWCSVDLLFSIQVQFMCLYSRVVSWCSLILLGCGWLKYFVVVSVLVISRVVLMLDSLQCQVWVLCFMFRKWQQNLWCLVVVLFLFCLFLVRKWSMVRLCCRVFLWVMKC